MNSHQSEINFIEENFERLSKQDPKEWSADDKACVEKTIEALDQGARRVCEKAEKGWQVISGAKQAILLYFKLQKMEVISAGDLNFFDKIPLKKWTSESQVRVVPHALVRRGAHIENGAILMPSYTNIGAFVGSGSMVDTWATVGSCAQIGRNVHLSGGVGIGGVLEPLQAQPVIIEDHAFIGSRSIIVEGVRVGEGAVIGAGTTLTASTKILDVRGETEKEWVGEVPPYTVVIPATRTRKFPSGSYQIPCALIIGDRSEKTDKKTSLNQILRDHNIC